MREAFVLHDVLKHWGAHPQLRIWRVNTGVGWFANGQPARKTDPGAYPVEFGVKGQADISGLLLPTGRRLEIETKTQRGRQSEHQKRWQAMIERMGGLYVLARGLGDVDQALAAVGVRR